MTGLFQPILPTFRWLHSYGRKYRTRRSLDPSRPLAQPVCQSFIPPMCQRLCRSFPAPSNHSSFRPIQTFGTASLSKLYTRQCASDSVSHFELGITIPVSLHHAPKQRAFDLPWNRTFSRGDMATCQLTAASRLSACCHCFQKSRRQGVRWEVAMTLAVFFKQQHLEMHFIDVI